MASGRISVEPIIHKVISDVVQNIYDQYGIKVSSVSVDWLDLSDMTKADMRVVGVNLSTHKVIELTNE